MPERNGKERIIAQPRIDIEANKNNEYPYIFRQWKILDKKEKERLLMCKKMSIVWISKEVLLDLDIWHPSRTPKPR